MKRLLVLLTTLLLPLTAYSAQSLKVIPVYSPPYSMESNQEVTGYTTEIVRLMMAELQQSNALAIYPLKRALNMASTQANVLIYPITRTLEREKQFHWIGKISRQNSYLFKLKSRTKLNTANLEQATSLNVGIVRGSAVASQLAKLGFNNIFEVTTSWQNIGKLQKHRIDLIASDEVTFRHAIDQVNRTSKTKLKYQDFEKVLKLQPESANELYIALSKTSSNELLNQVEQAYNKVTSSGSVIEVVHWWTMGFESTLVDVYRRFMNDRGLNWVDYTFEGGAGHNINQILDPQINSGHIPQAIRSYMGPAMQIWPSDKLLELDNLAKTENWQNQLPEVVNQNIKVDGGYYAVPINMQRVNWMWLNPSVFQQANAKIPSTWDEFLASAEKIKQAGFTPVSIGSHAWQEGTLFEMLVLSIGGEDFYRRLFFNLESELFSSTVMDNILNLMAKIRKYSNYQETETTWLQATNKLIDQKAAVYFMGDWVNGAIKSKHIPYGEDGLICKPVIGTEQIVLLNTDVFVFPKTKKSDELSQKTMASMLMNEEVQLSFNIIKGSIPARIDLAIDNFDPCSKTTYALAKQNKLLPSFNFGQVQPESLKSAIVEKVSDYFRGKIDKKATMQSMRTIIDAYHTEDKTVHMP